jgi:drug/metabolite transporter (DMT)-like permease
MLLPFVNTTATALFLFRNVFLIISLLFIGVFGTFAGYFLWFDGLTKVKPIAAGTTLYIVPFATVIFASFLIAEPITWTTILGGTVILLGLVIAGIKSRKQLR